MRDSKVVRVTRQLSVVIALLGVTVGAWWFIAVVVNTRSIDWIETAAVIDSGTRSSEEVSALLESVQEDLQLFIEWKSTQPESQDTEGAATSMRVHQLEADIATIQEALGSDIERTLSVPLLRNDLNQLDEKVTENSTTAIKQIDRIYDQNKWFIGLMATMSVGLLTLAISNFLQGRNSEA